MRKCTQKTPQQILEIYYQTYFSLSLFALDTVLMGHYIINSFIFIWKQILIPTLDQ